VCRIDSDGAASLEYAQTTGLRGSSVLLIRRILRANPTWGSPRIVGELGKLGIVVAKSTV
jgi:hypothetical protein